jgi:Spy/CpxP family protein refolding chaperone
MKKLFTYALTFSLLAFASSSSAQDGQRPGRGQDRRQGTFQGGRTAALLSEKDIEELKLDSKQKDKVSAIVKDLAAKQKEILEKGRADRTKLQEAIAERRKATEEATTRIKAVLNDDQKKKFDDLQKNRRGGRGAFGGGQGPFGGGRAFGTRFVPGQVLPPAMAQRLELTDDQKAKISALEKKTKDELNSILTDDQKKKLEAGPQGGGRGDRGDRGDRGGRPGAGGRGGRPGGAGGAGGRPGF